MSIYSYRFGQEGVNLARNNSFRLQITNNSSNPYSLSLFNLGGGSANQTTISTGTISQNTTSYVNIYPLLNGVAITNYTCEIRQGATILVTVSLLAGTNLQDLMNAIPSVTNLQGDTGTFFISEKEGSISGKEYDMVVSAPNIDQIRFNTIVPLTGSIQPMSQITATYVNSNPLVKINSTADINFIQNSETTNSLKILGIDVYSSNGSQLLQGLNYQYRDANGNFISFGTDPVVDPYQPNSASLEMVYVDDFQIHTNTTFNYTIEPYSSVYLTFNYVRFGVADLKEFDKILTQQSRNRLLSKNFIVDAERLDLLQIE
jgi:hypothetical protein